PSIIITGMADKLIENVSLKNVKVVFAGGGNESVATSSVDSLFLMDSKYKSYPDYEMFGELPAWGLLSRFVNGLSLENVTFDLVKPDYRSALVAEKCNDVSILNL